jgi:hypothetical protein
MYDLFFFLQVCPHDVRLLFGEHIVAAHATAPGETIIAASVADPHVLLHLSTGAAQVLCAVVEGGEDVGGALRAALEPVGVVTASGDPVVSCSVYADTSGMFRVVSAADLRKSGGGGGGGSSGIGGSTGVGASRAGDGAHATSTAAFAAASHRMSDAGDVDDIDAMLYGDDDDDDDDDAAIAAPAAVATPAAAPQRTTSKPASAAAGGGSATDTAGVDGAAASGVAAATHWCVVARASGALEVLEVPTLEARFTFRMFMTIPRTLVDDGETARRAVAAGTDGAGGSAAAGQADDNVDMDEMGGMAGDTAGTSSAPPTNAMAVDVDLDDAATAAAAAVAIQAAAESDDANQSDQPADDGEGKGEGGGSAAASAVDDGAAVAAATDASGEGAGAGEAAAEDAQRAPTVDYPYVREVMITGLGGGSRPCLACVLSSGHFAVYEAFRAVKIAHEGRLGLRFRKLDSDLFFNEPEMYKR